MSTEKQGSPQVPETPSPSETLEEHRTARAYYWQAIDDIYNDGEAGRNLVIKHFGLWHPPYHRKTPAPSLSLPSEQEGQDGFGGIKSRDN
jgi:hypothetical protein